MRAPSSSIAFLIKLLLMAALTAILFLKFDLRQIVRYLTWDKLTAALAIQPIILIGFGLSALRLATLTGARPLPVAASFKAITLCYGANVVLPGRVSEFLKATYLRDHAGVALGSGLSAVFLERIADFLMLGVLAFVAAVVLVTGFNTTVAFMALAALVAVFGLPMVAPRAIRFIARVPSERIQQFFHRFIEHSVERITHRTFVGVLALSVLMWLIALAGIALLFGFVASIPIGITGALVVFVASTIGGAVPALPGGFGTYEAAVVFVLRGYGYEMNEALALALTLHASQIALACSLAPVIAMKERTGLRALIDDAVAAVRGHK